MKAKPAGAERRPGRTRTDDALSLDSIARNLPGNVVRRVLHPDGRFTYAFLSEGLKETFDIEPADIMGQRDVDFGWIHPEDRRPFIDKLHDSARTLAPIDIENRVVGHDGRMRWVRSIATTRRLPDGRVVWDGVALDVTDKKRAEEEMRAALASAEQADQAKTRFLAAASHDLRQPLQAMRLHLAGLRMTLEQDAARRKLDDVERCADSMEELLTSLLDISKLDAGMVEPRLAAVDLQAFVERLSVEVGPAAEAAGLRLTTEGVEGTVRVDPVLLGTICRNILDNAVKYTAAGGRVTIRARLRPVPRILIADSGIGIAPEESARVFEPFAQLDNAARDRAFGLGLGLAIVARTAPLIGAKVRMRSRPGRGTLFVIALPDAVVAEPVAVAAEVRPVPSPGRRLQGRAAWILEDDLEIRAALVELLQTWGMDTRTAGTAAELEALARAGDLAPDVVIADFRLPCARNGGEAIAALRETLGRAVPGVILTGDTAPARLREARSNRCLVLHKPVKAGRLKAALQACLASAEAPTGAVGGGEGGPML